MKVCRGMREGRLTRSEREKIVLKKLLRYSLGLAVRALGSEKKKKRTSTMVRRSQRALQSTGAAQEIMSVKRCTGQV